MGAREDVRAWVDAGRIAPADVRRALEVAGAIPDGAAWRAFVDRVLLWLGTTGLAAGMLFFLAHNWDGLGRFAKLGLVEAVVLVALALVWRLGLDRPSGKAALLAASLAVGGLFALIGQTYQTGADTFELFGAWATAILPWAVLGRFAALWVLWLLLVNLATAFYFQVVAGLFGMLMTTEREIWLLFAVNTLALGVWETLATFGWAWLRERWAPRLIATAAGSLVTVLALWQIVGDEASGWCVPVWTLWLGAAYAVYRRRRRDAYVLAGGVLSVVAVVATFLAEHFLQGRAEAFAFLVIGTVVIAISALGGLWLRRVVAEEGA